LGSAACTVPIANSIAQPMHKLQSTPDLVFIADRSCRRQGGHSRLHHVDIKPSVCTR
jgi:hypothetical protein